MDVSGRRGECKEKEHDCRVQLYWELHGLPVDKVIAGTTGLIKKKALKPEKGS
jgi:hypothetical protein